MKDTTINEDPKVIDKEKIKELTPFDGDQSGYQQILSKINHIDDRLASIDEKLKKLSELTSVKLLEKTQDQKNSSADRKQAGISKYVSGWSSVKGGAERSFMKSYQVTRFTRGSPWAVAFSFREWAFQFRREMANRAEVADPVIYSVAQASAPKPVRPRIMHAIPNVHIGGSTQLVFDILNGLNNKFDMQVMTSSFPPLGHHEGVAIHDFGRNTQSEDFIRVLKEFDPAILHVHYWGSVDDYWYEKVFHAARFLSIPVIQNINTPVSPFNYTELSKVVYVSRYVQDHFPSSVGRENERVIYPGMDLQAFVSRKPISADAFDSIGMVYRLETDKLNAESIDPFIEVVQKRKNTRVFIIGGGSLLAHFKERVREAGVGNNFQFTGYVSYSELPSLYEKFSIFIAPVWKESFGQVAPFAMHMGRAVAGYDIGALSEILGGRSPLATNSGDLSDLIVDLLNRPEDLRRIGEINMGIAAKKFGINTMIESYGRIYDEMIGGSHDDPFRFFPKNVIFTDE